MTECKTCKRGFMTFYNFKTFDGLAESISFCSNARCSVNERKILQNNFIKVVT